MSGTKKRANRDALAQRVDAAEARELETLAGYVWGDVLCV